MENIPQRSLFMEGGVETFENYVAKTNDPGVWMVFFTLITCILITLALPILVILGKRYEKKRIMEEETALMLAAKEAAENHNNNATVPHSNRDTHTKAPKSRVERKHTTPTFGEPVTTQIDEEVDVDLELAPKTNAEVTFDLPAKTNSQKRRHRRQRSYDDPSVVTRSTRGSRKSGISDNHSVMTGMTNASSYIHGRARSEVSTASSIAWKNLVDKVIICWSMKSFECLFFCNESYVCVMYDEPFIVTR